MAAPTTTTSSPRASKTRWCERGQHNRAERFFRSPRASTCSTCLRARVRNTSKNARLINTYDITLEEYDEIVASQGGVCAGCGGRRKVYDVDHDHAVEKVAGPRASVRGALCRSDNKVLAYVRDSPERLRALADYLEHPPAHAVLTDERRTTRADTGT